MSEGVLERLGRWWRGRGEERAPELVPAAPAEPERPEEERWLEALVADVGEGKRLDDIGGDDFWRRVDAIWKRGDERLAADWVEKLLAAPATPAAQATALRVRLVELHERRGDLLAAVPHLERLSGVDEHAARAHYLLGEHYRRQGDEVRAIRHYEAVLARDVDYPNVRARLERLRQVRGRATPLAMGETIAGPEVLGVTSGARYLLVRELGRGGTGVVYLARDSELEREVAVKLLHPHLLSSQSAEACARFFEEARISASLRHPNIIAVLDMDERARRIVMELAAGGTLRQVLRERGPRPLRRALERHAQILSALAAAHRRGIVHRDLKPGNLMFRRDPDAPGAEVMLGDFGVAHLSDVRADVGADVGAGVAGAGAAPERREAVGTLAYMAPEQRRGAEVDPRSDLYAAAVVLYEMLTGRYPWPREVLLAGIRSATDFALPAEVVRDASAELVERLGAHLMALGEPRLEARPDTQRALEEARELRDLAIAGARA